MRNLFIVLFAIFFSFSKAQEKSNTTSYFLINIGYSNLNGNYLNLGPEFYLVQDSGNIIDLRATANMAYFKDQFVVVPEVGIGYQFNSNNKYSKANPYREYINASFYTARVNVSPWNVTPEIGVTLIGLLEANVGYSFEYREHKHTSFDGIKFGLTLHLPGQLLF